jgi:3-methylcrotonyl-CoA carboxylase alpha subunit
MEMNTRLQVEHPVTEEITGVDLVEWQLRVASGEPLPLRQDELSIDGHAIEARLYAEDPAKGFLPSVGRLEFFELDGSVRIDTGVCQGSEVSPFYDPMIAKMIAHDLDREGAIQSLAWALNDSKIWPVKNNAAFLINALEHPDFASGNVDTGLIQRAGDALIPDENADIDDLARSAEQYTNQAIAGFRLNGDRNHKAVLSVDGVAAEVDIPIVEYVDPRPFVFSQNAPSGFFQTGNGQTWWVEPYRYTGGAHASAHDGDILSPMPGRIIAVDVAAGDVVTKGQKLLTLEAMKMEHSLTAPFDGVVAELNAEAGAQVQVEALLVRIEAVE